jgi:hypothetical protein
MREEVVIRHAASNQLQRNAPHCKPPAAPKRPPDRRQTAPAPACAYPALRLAITNEASPLALRSTRKSSEDSTASGDALLAPSGRTKQQQVVALLWLWAETTRTRRSIRLGNTFFAVRSSRGDDPMDSYDWGNDLVRWAWWARQGSDLSPSRCRCRRTQAPPGCVGGPACHRREALGVDPEQDLDRVAGPLGHRGGRHAAVEPGGHGRVPKVVGRPRQR